MESRAVLNLLVSAAMMHVGEETASLERNVGGFEKRQLEKIYDRGSVGEPWHRRRWLRWPNVLLGLARSKLFQMTSSCAGSPL